MATTRISDVVVPEVYTNYDVLKSVDSDSFVRSGLAVNVSMFDDFLRGGGDDINVPYWGVIGGQGSSFEEPSRGSDDPSESITPNKIEAKRDIAMRQIPTKAWSTMDLSGALAGSDPMQAIVNQVEYYYTLDAQKRLINSANGVIADSVANYSSDMVNDISVSAGGTVGAANKISGAAIVDTLQTMGDAKDMLTAIGVHSVVHAQMQKLNLIDTIPNSDANIGFGTYLGKSIVVNDSLPVEVYDTDKTKYTSVLFGQGAFAYGRAFPVSMMPNEVDRKPELGNGTGQENLYTRRQALIHPYGYQFATATVTGGGYYCPSYAQLATAGLWTRAYDERKRIKIAALVSNGD